MSTAHVDIGYDLIEGIFTVLDGNVTYSGTTYPVYKSKPKTPATIHVHIHNMVHDEDGTKDDFVYRGTIQVEVVDESKQRADMKLAQKIRGVVRGLLKTTKASVFSIGDSLTLIAFTPGPNIESIELADNGITRMRLIDIYEFIIE